MTGNDLLARQIRIRSIAITIPGCVAIAVLVFAISLKPSQTFTQALGGIFVCCMIAIPVVVVVLRQRCPFCHRTLTLDSKRTYYGEFCRHCGGKFVSEIPDDLALREQGKY